MASVKLRDVNKIYPNGLHALHDINLDIEEGEFMVVVGPSGCAKSTMLRMIAGLENISSGELTIADKICNDVQPKDRGIAMVFQNYALYPHMTVYENMAFGLKVAKKTKAEIALRVHEAAELLEITELLQRKPKEMSGGQCQRVALGRAMVRKPAVFLFDEPLSNLDAKLRVSMRLRISKLHQQLREAGKPATMIYVTHDQVEAMTMGERVCILRKGEIMQVDRPLNVYHHPRNKFVAEFIGSPAMNLFTARVERFGDQIVLRCGEHIFSLPEDKSTKAQHYLGQEIYFGIRPEDININAKNTINSLSSKITRVDAMGADEYIHFTMAGQQVICKQPNPEGETNINSNYQFYFNMDKCHLFDRETEKNIL
ncbi:sn-glycerol-3-phosphate ABC transporter ATP-binding protein UgpC [Serratia sp. UGAL515B_01]|uniref:ABC transporter ATP-binding protein n=1 Tax=Serratia sp. UGAL515B_01 TaxID=2986763 RepID=UPI002954317E|nr:sn-glycerol-3-phosphate ABC transporter ATP-binding protein UgpC [Serratia sp. UGAL515B_01]WON78836.1 sn-glycerol-3-phosphate ABC transporter ATP-binding protein UgpC [Serratia sp. UGAL515B_01]